MNHQEKAKRYNDMMNEGGEGYNPHAAAAREEAYQAKINSMVSARNAALIAKGFDSREATEARRAEWNAMVQAGQITAANRKAVEAKLGWTMEDLKAAKAVYGIN